MIYAKRNKIIKLDRDRYLLNDYHRFPLMLKPLECRLRIPNTRLKFLCEDASVLTWNGTQKRISLVWLTLELISCDAWFLYRRIKGFVLESWWKPLKLVKKTAAVLMILCKGHIPSLEISVNRFINILPCNVLWKASIILLCLITFHMCLQQMSEIKRHRS